MKHEQLAGLEAAFEIAAVKEFAAERETVLVLHQEVVDGVAASHATHGGAAGDTNAQRVDAVGSDVFDLGKMDAVFVSERKVSEQVFQRVDAAFGEEFGALRADAFD